MLLPHGTIVALVDGKNFALFRNAGNEAEPELVAQDTPKLDTHNHSGASHHASSGTHGGALVAEESHAIAAVEWLNAQVLGHHIEHLVVVAPPRTLGEMRRHYHKQLEHALLADVAKDLWAYKGPEILAALRGR